MERPGEKGRDLARQDRGSPPLRLPGARRDSSEAIRPALREAIVATAPRCLRDQKPCSGVGKAKRRRNADERQVQWSQQVRLQRVPAFVVLLLELTRTSAPSTRVQNTKGSSESGRGPLTSTKTRRRSRAMPATAPRASSRPRLAPSTLGSASQAIPSTDRNARAIPPRAWWFAVTAPSAFCMRACYRELYFKKSQLPSTRQPCVFGWLR